MIKTDDFAVKNVIKDKVAILPRREMKWRENTSTRDVLHKS